MAVLELCWARMLAGRSSRKDKIADLMIDIVNAERFLEQYKMETISGDTKEMQVQE